MEGDKNQNQTGPNADKNRKEPAPAPNMDMYGDNYLRRIGMQVSPHFAYTTNLALVLSSSFIYLFNYYYYYIILC